jgi:hypothetical protein
MPLRLGVLVPGLDVPVGSLAGGGAGVPSLAGQEVRAVPA